MLELAGILKLQCLHCPIFSRCPDALQQLKRNFNAAFAEVIQVQAIRAPDTQSTKVKSSRQTDGSMFRWVMGWSKMISSSHTYWEFSSSTCTCSLFVTCMIRVVSM
jgi:hypothetical protein